MAEINQDKAGFTIRLRDDDRIEMNEILSNLEAEGKEVKQNDREIFTAILQQALRRSKPREVSKKEDIERIKYLEEQVKQYANQEKQIEEKLEEHSNTEKKYVERNQELETQAENLQSEKQQLAEAYKALKNTLSEKENTIQNIQEEKQDAIQELEKTQREKQTLEGKIIVEPNRFERQLINKVLQSDTPAKINNNTEKTENFLTYIDPAAEEDEQTAELLLNALKIHALGKLMSMPFSPKQIFKAYQKFVAEAETETQNS